MAKKLNVHRISRTHRKELLAVLQIRLAEAEAARRRSNRVIH